MIRLVTIIPKPNNTFLIEAVQSRFFGKKIVYQTSRCISANSVANDPSKAVEALALALNRHGFNNENTVREIGTEHIIKKKNSFKQWLGYKSKICKSRFKKSKPTKDNSIKELQTNDDPVKELQKWIKDSLEKCGFEFKSDNTPVKVAEEQVIVPQQGKSTKEKIYDAFNLKLTPMH